MSILTRVLCRPARQPSRSTSAPLSWRASCAVRLGREDEIERALAWASAVGGRGAGKHALRLLGRDLVREHPVDGDQYLGPTVDVDHRQPSNVVRITESKNLTLVCVRQTSCG
jgi:hypothetical protein